MPVVTIGGRKVFVVPELPILKPHEPIYIDGDPDFIKENGVVSGSGTSTDPYVIENWDIDTSENGGIGIRDTTVCFIIRNCNIHEGGDDKHNGVDFISVRNVKIESVTSYNNGFGFYMNSSSNISMTNCNVYNNSYDGIHIYKLLDTQIINCNVYKNFRDGIYLSSSSNNNIHYNNIYSNKEYDVHNVTLEKEYVVDGTNNWWGYASGPNNKVSRNVIFKPWLKNKR